MKLSTRESEILNLLQHGLTNKEIGQHLNVSPHTVRDHVSAMLARFGLNGRTALVVFHIHKSGRRKARLPNQQHAAAASSAKTPQT